VRASDVFPPEFPMLEGRASFTDVEGNTHADDIARAEQAGIAEGRADGRFQPGSFVQRDQGASFLTRWLDWRADRAGG
jgi:hypothetical protein